MSEQLPYEDDLLKRLNELPLPDENLAWADMKRRLDKEDNSRPVIFPFLKSCGGIIFLLLLFIITYVLVKDPANLFHKKPGKSIVKATTAENRQSIMDSMNNRKQLQDTNGSLSVMVYRDSSIIKTGSVENNHTPAKINLHSAGP